jgi:hypothetical protein
MDLKLEDSKITCKTIDARHFLVMEFESIESANDTKKVILKAVNNTVALLEIISEEIPKLREASERASNSGQIGIAGNCSISSKLETLEFVRNILQRTSA